MADPVKTPSETPNQPAVETPPAAAAAPAAVAKVADPAPKPAPTSETPPAAAPKAAATATPPAELAAAAPGATDEQAKALVDAAAAKATADAAVAATVPAEVKYEIKPPEGVQIDPELLPALTPSLKKAGLTNEQLGHIVEGYLEFAKAVPQRMLARDLEITSKDKDIGGLRYAQTLKEVNLAIEAFADPDFKKFVQQAGIANRLEFVRVFQRIGAAMARAGDVPERGSPDAAPETSRAQRMYGGGKKPT